MGEGWQSLVQPPGQRRLVQREIATTAKTNPINRNIKVEEVGDFHKKRTFPRIRLKGQWLDNAGFSPNTRVVVDHSQHGVLVIQLIDNNQ